MKYVMKVLLLVSVLLFVGCGGLDEPQNEQVIGGEIVVDMGGDSVKKSLLDANMPGVTQDTAVYGYRAYKIPYYTTNEQGQSVLVSGLMVVPTGMPEQVYEIGLSLVSDDHGTIMANYEAPTQMALGSASPEGSAIILTSLAGFVTLQPDYIGFGDSLAEYHPFVMKKSLASATIDFIYAAKKFASDNGINLNGQLFLTGYSEGGYAALATLQSIESDDKLQVTMAAPMAGPYDVNTTAFSMLSQDIMPIPSYMADIAYSYALTYNQPIESIVNEPYASQLSDLFSGEYERVVVDTYLTTQTTGADGLFNPLFVQDFFINDTNWFREAIVVNSVHAWAPQTSVRLVHCKGDDVIPFGMSELTEGTMKAYGANDVAVMPVEALLGIEELGHVACGLPAYSLTAQLFTTVRQATMKY